MSMPRMPWGKFKGKLIEDIPIDYINWALRETDIADTYPDVAEEMQAQIALSEGHGVVRQKGSL
jgi:uncharacterized protein (DUF3820 family)